MTIDGAMRVIITQLNGIMIPGSESGKLENVKNDLRAVEKFARSEAERVKALEEEKAALMARVEALEQEKAKEERADED